MNSGLDYRYLKAFEATANNLSFSLAASELGVAQSAISRQVKLLEESLGETLIIRSSKKVLLTDKGQKLLKLIQEFDQKSLELTGQEVSQKINVGLLHGLLENWFIDVICAYADKSNHELHIDVDTTEELIKKISRGELDFIFITEDIQNDLLTSRKLFKETFSLISTKKIDPKKVSEYDWITYSSNDYLHQLYKKTSGKVTIVKSITAILKLVQKGLGVAIVPDHFIPTQTKFNRHQLSLKQKHSVYLASLNYQRYPEHLKDFLDTTIASLK